MGLERDDLAMLTATATWTPWTGVDTWGNETYGAPVSIQCFIDATSRRLGGEARTSQKSKQPTEDETALYTDALGIKPKDKITYGGTDKWVTEVETIKDESGDDLMQTVTVSTTKRG